MSPSFADLGVPAEIVSALDRRGITSAFPIQALAVPPALEGRDVCGKAPTGSGKTLAFGIPLALKVTKARPHHPRALVLAPTRELATQIRDELVPLLEPRGRRVATFFGGVGFGPQMSALRKGVDVAVACPGRLADLVSTKDLMLDEVEFVVIDEADRMADMGFLPEVRRLLDRVRPDRQTLLFSATLDGDVDVLIRNYQKSPERCEIESEDDNVDRNAHHFVMTERPERVERTAQLLREHGTGIVFVRTKHGADRVAKQLGRAGVEAVPIHGGRSQNQRTRALAAFTDGHALALVATDVAARGIHVDDVQCVIHFDVAGEAKDYVHRSGRTGRAGRQGVVVSLVTSETAKQARSIQRELDLEHSTSMPGRPDGGPSIIAPRPSAKPVHGEYVDEGDGRRSRGRSNGAGGRSKSRSKHRSGGGGSGSGGKGSSSGGKGQGGKRQGGKAYAGKKGAAKGRSRSGSSAGGSGRGSGSGHGGGSRSSSGGSRRG